MFKAIVLLLCSIFAAANLAAIGYTSAYVETERQVEEARRLEASSGGIEKGLDDMEFGSSATPAPYATYASAHQMELAMPSLNPMADTTTKLIYSLMDVIFSRFKQQLFISSVAQWREELLDSDVRYLFPNLAGLLDNSDAENFLTSYGLWQAAIERDLNEAPVGVLGFTLHMLENDSRVKPEQLALVGELRNLLSDVYNFRNVGNLDEFILASTSTETQSDLFRIIGMVAKNMLDENGEFALNDLSEKVRTDPEWAYRYVQNVQADIDDLRLNNDSFRVSIANLSYYLDSCATVESFFDQLSPEPAPSQSTEIKPQKTSAFVKLYLSTCDKLLVQWSHLKTSAQNDWDAYYGLYTKYRFQVDGLTRQIDSRDYKGLLNTLITTSVDIAGDRGYISMPYSRFLNLITTIALNSDEREMNYREVMNSILEPVGSYTYKRRSSFTVALNSYPGLGGGVESLDSDFAKSKAVAGLSCPIGLELNWGQGALGMRGLFLSALDLGAIATYRFTQGDSLDSGSPQLGWKQLVSPGLYLLLQTRDHPVTLGLGVQMTPSLRKVTDSGVALEKNAFRLGAFLSLDIPIFTFYVKHNWLERKNQTITD